ncbi:hypothetical protein [Pseudomonas abieticivorans]|uniref:hypothetical protein n=1 Tax=Pseudomonas abieticivorans TaxID=2931382 RepID=UPI0020BFB80E|nr:hypothetical protein [Pseudomonas sp. PIA16]
MANNLTHGITLIILAVTSNAALAISPITATANAITSVSHSAVCGMFANDTGSVGKAVRRQCVRQAQQEFARQPDRKTLQDCIKPGSLIDDDVRNCMKGL